MLRKKYRLNKKDNISKIIRNGKHFSSKLFLGKIMPNKISNNRFAIVISKKVEKKAVKRNQTRRRIYEAIRNDINLLTDKNNNFDIVLLINQLCINTHYLEIQKEIKKINL